MAIGFIDILPLALVGVAITKMKYVKSGINESYLSIDTGKALRGFFAIAVVLHHISQETNRGILLHDFVGIGYIIVAVFFFLSGYGLQKSYIMNADRYREFFLLKRMHRIIIPYIIVTCIFWFVLAFFGNTYSFKDILIAIINGNPIVDYSWYIISISLFYVAFWLLINVCREKNSLIILGACIWQLIYINFCIKMGYGYWWYKSNHLLIVGMCWALYEKKILMIIKGTYYTFAIAIWTLFILMYRYKVFFAHLFCVEVFCIDVIIAMLFVLSILTVTMRFEIGNKMLWFLGDISLEIYLVQGLFVLYTKNYIKNDFCYALTVVFGSIFLAWILHYADNKILLAYSKFLKGHIIKSKP